MTGGRMLRLALGVPLGLLWADAGWTQHQHQATPATRAPAAAPAPAPTMPTPGCTPEHAAMGHCTLPPPPPQPKAEPPADLSCPPEHAAMGHCTPRPAAPQPKAEPPATAGCTPEHAAMGHCTLPPPSPQPKAEPPADPSCPPEHAAMGHCTPRPAAPQPKAEPPADPSCPPEHAAMGHCTLPPPPSQPKAEPPADPSCPPEHAAMGHCTPRPQADAAAAPGATVPPRGVRATYADRIWGADAMAPARAQLRREHGGGIYSQVMIDIAELQVRDGRDGYRWEGEAWLGGDINRLLLKTEGEGELGGETEAAEIQALYSRAIGPYFNLQAGVRQDIEPGSATYAAFGVEGLAPYWFEVEAHGFVSTDGDVLARLAASYDQRITQRLILQPRAELNFAAQDVAETGVGRGLDEAEFDLRLRYEFRREFAPYIGVSHSVRTGRGADFARAAGEDPSVTSLVAGVRAWF